MKRFGLLIVIAVLAVAPRVSAACRQFGTQLQCNVGSSRLVIGTQTAEEASPAGTLPVQSLRGGRGLGDGAVASRRPLEIQLQNFGGDPALCRKIGNETYCY